MSSSKASSSVWRTLLVLALSLLVAVTAASDAAASGSGHWVCGPRGSAQIPGGLIDHVPILYSKGLRAAPPPRPHAFYWIGLSGSRSCALVTEDTAFFIPRAGEVRISGPDGNAFWTKLSSRVAVRLRKLVRKVRPYGGPKRLREVTINDVSARHPSSYLHLYTLGTPTRSASSAAGWLPILFFGTTSPWTDGKNSLWISRHGAYLRRDGQLVRLSASLATRVRRGEPIP